MDCYGLKMFIDLEFLQMKKYKILLKNIWQLIKVFLTQKFVIIKYININEHVEQKNNQFVHSNIQNHQWDVQKYWSPLNEKDNNSLIEKYKTQNESLNHISLA